MPDIKISDLAATTSMLGTDEFPVARSGTTRRVSADNLIQYLGTSLQWKAILSTLYTALPLSTSRIAMSDTSGFVVGDAVRVLQGVNLRYGIINAISTNTYIEIVGELLASGVAIDALSVGAQSQYLQLDLWAASDYASVASTTLLSSKSRGHVRWNNRPARLVEVLVTQNDGGSGTQPRVNVRIAGSRALSLSSNQGVQLSATSGTWVSSGIGAINELNNRIERGESIELECSTTNSTVRDLSASLIFVIE